MNLDKENLKKIRGLILFTIVVLIVLWKYSLVLDALGFVLGIVFPFLLGGAIAFILNVPMHFLEKTLFYNKKTAGKAWAQKLARPLSLVLTILFVLGVISLVIFVAVSYTHLDIQDIRNRLMRKLKGIGDGDFDAITEKVILVARDLAPSDTAKLNLEYILGFITELGGVTSHV